jgi:hypothetical protein
VAGVVGPEAGVGFTVASWYYDASATWAEWHPSLRALSKAHLYDLFQGFQETVFHQLHSLLWGGEHAYESWVWPLFQELEGGGATAIYQTWAAAESASDDAGIDAAVNSKLPFAANFRDFSVRNLQPAEYFANSDTGLEDESWQSRISDFPTTPHHVSNSSPIVLRAIHLPANVEPLAAQNDAFTITEPRVRQVTIDLSPLKNAGSADLDIVGQLAGDTTNDTEPHRWRRISADSSTYTFCRDIEEEDFARFYVVVSNHASNWDLENDPDAALVTGVYNVEAKDRCDVPIRYEGTFNVNQTVSPSSPGLLLHAEGHVTFKYVSTAAGCGSPVPPTPDSLQYCYRLDSAQETWTAPPYTVSGCHYIQHDAQFSYPNDDGRHGDLVIIRRSPDPAFDNLYTVSMASNTKTMDVEVIPLTKECVRPPGTITIGLPAYAITDSCYGGGGPQRFTGWALSGSCTFHDDLRDFILTTTWSWDLTPIFQP